VSCYLLSLGRYLDRPSGARLAVLAATTALACLTRYIGITTIFAGSLSILVFLQANLKKKLLACTVYGLGSTLPLILWLTRNYVRAATLTGERSPATGRDLGHVLERALRTFDAWFLPPSVLAHTPATDVLIGLWGLVLVAVVAVSYRFARSATRSVLPATIFAATYFAFLTSTSLRIGHDPMDDRLLSPMFVPLLLVIVVVSAELSDSVRGRISRRVLDSVLAAVALVWLVVPARSILAHVDQRETLGGWQYGSRSWRESETIRFVNSGLLPTDCIVYSNEPYALYVNSGVPVDVAPSQSELTEPDVSAPGPTPICVVWFTDLRDPSVPRDRRPTELPLTKLASFSDGAVYRIEPRQ
jgi:hypothetical protein